MLTHFSGGAAVEATMDVDSWNHFLSFSSDHSSKHLSSHRSSESRMQLDNSEVNDGARTYFTCPFCYVDTELSVLCSHLQEEHCFDVKNAVCPLCALNLGKDIVGHFKVHHASSIKSHRKSQKSGLWNSYAGKRYLGALGTKSGSEHVNASAPDPLLSPFLCPVQYSETKSDQLQNTCYSEDVSPINETESSRKLILSQCEHKEDSEELRQRAAFCQQLIFSTII